ncbi:spermidine/putrescine ABC transporter permease [Mesorhizobium sanjuanii]|uniref:Spermidine/putrescine ABC transporter permease n=1 Tax=Mesorhizobium sanjuanii TaxID=2037900 RepID=A0A2A6FKK7_9HYPH|nr:ABC transporter permease [Mesorhizobium sanjuanii]PDQ22265.1 spermidine/putrescine ABC transporter permease [Mesorhizobium sanjuanii]
MSSASDVSFLSPRSATLLVAPLGALLILFFAYPLVLTVWQSFYEGGFTLRAYAELATSTLFYKVLRTTFVISLTATLVSLFIGYPVALHLSRQSPRRRTFYLMLVMLPFWTSILVKSFALTVLLGHSGIVNQALGFISGGTIQFPMVFNRFGAIVGMINYLLPFMILSVLGSLLAQDGNLARAAEVMGAGPFRIFRQVTLPLSMPGVIAGIIINFTLSIGMYITPALLGGRQDMMIANLIDFYTRQTLDWPMASAISVVLLLISGALVTILGRVRGGAGVMGVAS